MMEELHDQNAMQAPDGVAPVKSLGEQLREAREQRGLSVEDVSSQIKFAPRQIEALEANDFSSTTEAAFLRGFVRSYGKLLQLDVETLLAALPQTKVSALTAEPGPDRMLFPNAQSARRQQNLIWMSGALVVVVAALGFAIANLTSPSAPGQQAVETPVDLPVATQEVAAQTAASAVPAVATEAEPTVPAKTVEENVAAKPRVEAPAEVASTKPKIEPAAKPAAKENVQRKPANEVVAVRELTTQTSAAPLTTAPETKTEKPIPIDMLLGFGVPLAKPAAAPETVTPAATSVSTPAASPADQAGSASLRIVLGEESWVEVKDKNGKVISSQTHPAGGELNLKLGHAAPYELAIGHGRAARLYYKGRQIDLAPHIKKFSAVAHVTLE